MEVWYRWKNRCIKHWGWREPRERPIQVCSADFLKRYKGIQWKEGLSTNGSGGMRHPWRAEAPQHKTSQFI